MASRLLPALAVPTLLFVGCDDSTTDAGGGGGGGGGGPTPGGTPVAAYVLVGGTAKPTVTDLYLDGGPGRLNGGELFIMAKDPLLTSTTYQVTYDITIGGTQYTGQWSFTTGTSAVGATTGASPVDELNRYRVEAGMPGVGIDANLTTAARRHCGYQCEVDTITHGETDTSADFFINNSFASRISIANGGTAGSNSWPGTGITTVYEIIATNGDVGAVAGLWNTVYHRLPMMRRHAQLVGEADRPDTFADALYPPVAPFPYTGAGTSNQQYETMEFSADSRAQIASFWPADGATGIGTTFNTNTESPDPVSSGNGNGTPDDTNVGVPIHLVLPSTANVTALSVTLSRL